MPFAIGRRAALSAVIAAALGLAVVVATAAMSKSPKPAAGA